MFSQLTNLFGHFPDNFGLDIAKPLIGSFAGAGLAFLSNNWFQKKERHRRNKAAGYLALSVLERQYNDFLLVRKGFNEEKKRISEQIPNAPKWLIRPVHYYFSDSLKFNYDSLTFLFDLEASDLFSKLSITEHHYYDLTKLTNSFNNAAEKCQEKMAVANIQEEQSVVLKSMESVIGNDLLGKTVSFLEGIDRRFDEDEKHYQDCIEKLKNLLASYFPSS
jgi:hypothetical protein